MTRAFAVLLALSVVCTARRVQTDSELQANVPVEEVTEVPVDDVENEEEQAAVSKCKRQDRPEKEGSTEETASSALAELASSGETEHETLTTFRETVNGLWQKNVSILSLLDRGSLAFKDYRCDIKEFRAFKTKYFPGETLGDCSDGDIIDGKTCPRGNVVWFYPAMDDSWAFCSTTQMCHRVTVWADVACSLQIYRVSSVQQATDILDSLPDDSIEHAVLGGHGDGVALEWGYGQGGSLKVTGEPKQDSVWPGAFVTVKKSIKSIKSKTAKVRVPFAPGLRGVVSELDSDGDALIRFDCKGSHWVNKSDFEHLKVSQSDTPDFLELLKQKMQQHGTIFADSCFSAAADKNPNLAQYIAAQVGKGTRVVGAETSLMRVKVRRFQPFMAELSEHRNGTDPMELEYVAKGGRCPRFASLRKPNEKGECRCQVGHECKTKSGNLCPAAGGKESNKYFMPSCAEEWVEDRCMCIFRQG